jgi:hypothetical protein
VTPAIRARGPEALVPGVYRHFKGGRYLLVAVAETHNHNGDQDVLYVVLASGKLCTRPLFYDKRGEDSWLDEVAWPDGAMRQRFTFESSISVGDMATLQNFWHDMEVLRTAGGGER